MDLTAGKGPCAVRERAPSAFEASTTARGVMTWAGIIGDRLAGPKRAPDGVRHLPPIVTS